MSLVFCVTLLIKMNVFMIAAVSADGFIGLGPDHRSLDWRSKADAKFFIERTKEAGVIVMGSTTYKTFRIKRAPPGRRLIVLSSKPETISGENVEASSESPRELITRLKREGAREVALSGGATIYKVFLEEGLVDEVYLTIEPKFFGSGVNLLSGAIDIDLKLIEVKKLAENTILAHYSVNKKA